MKKKSRRESYKKGKSKRTRDGKKSTINSGSGKSLTLYSQIQYSLCTKCEMYQANITKIIGLYNQ